MMQSQRVQPIRLIIQTVFGLVFVAIAMLSAAFEAPNTAVGQSVGHGEPILIDFNELTPGTAVDLIVIDALSLTITVASNGDVNQAVIFDSANPTGSDEDLATPNQTIYLDGRPQTEDCPFEDDDLKDLCGPGEGDGGRRLLPNGDPNPGANKVSVGNVLIIQENPGNDGVFVPDDEKDGGQITFDFSEGVVVNYFDLLDFEEDQVVEFTFFDAQGIQLGGVLTPMVSGDNSYAKYFPDDVGAAEGIARIVMELPISGAIGELEVRRALPAIRGTVFCDNDENGVPTDDEGLVGATVNLIDESSALTPTVTESDGEYIFPALALGTYTVTVDAIPSTCNFPSVDPDHVIDGMTVVSLTANQTEDAILDFGYRETPLGTIGDTVFCDSNNNGLPDIGEGMQGITVTLGGPISDTANTSDEGSYLFSNLPLGPYAVAISDLPPSCDLPTIDPDGSNDSMSAVTLTDDAPNNLDQDFGFVPAVGIAIEKATNGIDADVAPGPPITETTPVTWTYDITNTGYRTLVQIEVSDDQLDAEKITCPKTELAPGEFMTCFSTGTAILGPYANIGTVTSQTLDGKIVTDSDYSHYYGIPIEPSLDWGDAPDTTVGTAAGNYATVESSDGPHHMIVPGLYLGNGVDEEQDGQPTANADGDDTTGIDDEEGVMRDACYTHGLPISLGLAATNQLQTDARLYGWIDINGDGFFADSERADAMVASGADSAVTHLDFGLVPPQQLSTFLRLRISTDAAADQPTGFAINGEVEDHAIEFVMPTLETSVASSDSTTLYKNIRQTARLTALVNTACGSPQGISVCFDVLNDDAPATCQAADVGGIASYAYSRTIPSDDTINIWIDVDRDNELDDEEPITTGNIVWQDPKILVETIKVNDQSAESPPGASIDEGEATDWLYTIHNIGSVTLTEVSVTHSLATAVLCSSNTILPGERLNCSAQDTAELGLNTSAITAVGKTPSNETVSNSGTGYYTGIPKAPFILSVEPMSATIASANEHRLTAIVVDSQGQPARDQDVLFTITGPNSASSDSEPIPVDENGRASFSYTGLVEGRDLVTVVLASDQAEPVQANVEWYHIRDVTIELSPQSVQRVVGTDGIVSATVTDNRGQPVRDRTLQYEVSGVNSVLLRDTDKPTDAQGKSEIRYPYLADMNSLLTDTITVTVDLHELLDVPTEGSIVANESVSIGWIPVTMTVNVDGSNSNSLGIDVTPHKSITESATLLAKIEQDNLEKNENQLITQTIEFGDQIITGKALFAVNGRYDALPIRNQFYPGCDIELTSNQSPWVLTLWLDLNRDGEATGEEPTCIVEEPTAMIAPRFSAQPSDDAVHLSWSTGVEIGLLGFNVYRAIDPAGPFTKVNPNLILALGDALGADYSYDDLPLEEESYYYVLESVSNAGTIKSALIPVSYPKISDPEMTIYLPVATH